MTQTQTSPAERAERPREGQGQEMTYREKRQLQQQEGTRSGLYFEPAVDIYENDDALTLVADVPGTGPGDLEVDLRENVLTISGRVRGVEEGWKPLYREYRLGHYWRQFRLGQQIEQGKISAQLRDGVLTLTLPKAESAIPRKIRISSS